MQTNSKIVAARYGQKPILHVISVYTDIAQRFYWPAKDRLIYQIKTGLILTMNEEGLDEIDEGNEKTNQDPSSLEMTAYRKEE